MTAQVFHLQVALVPYSVHYLQWLFIKKLDDLSNSYRLICIELQESAIGALALLLQLLS